LRSPDHAQAQAWLDHLAHELESFSVALKTPSSARMQLDRILSRREFAGVKPPSPLGLLLQRIGAWIQSVLRRIFVYAAQHPTGGTVLFWLAAAGATGLLGFWLFRLWNGESRIPVAQLEPAVPARAWHQWVISAKEAAERGDLRIAIHCAYWAAVVRLQDGRLLPGDLTRTPREYLRLMPVDENAHAPLAGLTSALERFWYAGRAVGPDDFRESLTHLEALGCTLD